MNSNSPDSKSVSKFGRSSGGARTVPAAAVPTTTSAADLVAAGDQRIASWEGVVVEAVGSRDGIKPATVRILVSQTPHLLRSLQARGIETWPEVTAEPVGEWCTAARRDRNGRHRAVSTATELNRRWVGATALDTARALGAELDAAVAVAVRRGTRSAASTPTRPLTADEEAAVRDSALSAGLLLRPPLVPLAFAGGSAPEIAPVTRADVEHG